MNVELHILQNFAPSCLNRDDTNTPKDCTFGGHRRARISSQCVKRSVRRYFAEHELLKKENLAERSKRLIGHVAQLVVDAKQVELPAAVAAVKAALAAVNLATDAKKADETQYLLFYGNAELQKLAEVVGANFDALKPKDAPTEEGGKKKQTAKEKKSEAKGALTPEVVKAVKAVLEGNKAADVALFGRMLADQADLNIDAACQVAHALSTNRVDMEMDFFTAVDDLKARADEEDAGAGMLGTTEFNSACFYRYSNVQLPQLVKNLGGDRELARAAVKAYLEASVEAVPTGKQNSTAAQNKPSLVFAVVRKAGLWSLANAFETPVRPDGNGGLVQHSMNRLVEYWGRLSKAYGNKSIVDTAIFHLGDGVTLNGLAASQVDGLDALVEKVLAAIPEAP